MHPEDHPSVSMGPDLQRIAGQAIDAARKAGADSCDVLAACSQDYEVKVADGRVLCLTQATSRSMGLRVFVGGRLGFCTTTDLRPEALVQACQTAVALAREAAQDAHNGLAEDALRAPPTQGPNLDLYDPAIGKLTSHEKLAWAHCLEQAARAADPRVQKFRDSGVATSISHQVLATSAGLIYHQPASDISIWSTPVAEAHGELQTDFWYDTQPHLADLASLEEVGTLAANRAARMLGARSVPTQRVPVIFDAPSAAGLIAGMLPALDGDLVHKKASFLAASLGEAIACSHLTVTDDPWRRRGIASTQVDGEGVPTRTKALIDGGKLAMFLYDGHTARKVGVNATGSARRGTTGLPHTGTYNVGVSAGPHSEASLLRDAPRALLVTRGLGQGLNTVSGEYSRGAGGFWLEHGEVVHAVQEVTIAGNYIDMLKNIDGVGDTVTWRGSHGAPMLRVAEMMVSGS